MKKIALPVLAVFLTLSGVTLAQQSGDQKKGSSMMDSMPEMMKGKQNGEGGMHGMGDMSGMMGMMKVMEQCNDMMKSAQHQGDKAKETQKQ
ncbi:MAG: hypothetical protein E6J74_34300 [Deltaproteobacteria bacterium]|nr:MAG: hypothetical protein E6J74_34300 [Deltaproteobacteria bacterium]